MQRSAASLSSAGVAHAQNEPKRAQIETRLERIKTLTEDSSAARQIRESNASEAKARHGEARSLYREARAAYEAGDYTNAAELLKRATRVMFKAVRLANPEKVLEAKRRRDYESRLSSVNALLAAHQRVSREKGTEEEAGELRELVNRRVAHAEALAGHGELVKGRKALDEAYVAIKIAIESLRGGDTLVRTLDFATKEEEYHYELDRNESFRMLVNVLVTEKARSTPGLQKMVDLFMAQAARSRAAAEERARAGDFAAAVTGLEEATKHIGRAIRSAGIYIPGS